jgi:hypothetical protein
VGVPVGRDLKRPCERPTGTPRHVAPASARSAAAQTSQFAHGATVQPTVTPPLLLTESEARRMLLLRAFETVDPPPPDWSPADRDWATRVARTSVGVGADALCFIRERTTQALHALASRNAAVRTALAADRLFGTWLLVIVAAAGLLGLAADQIGSAQRINLLAPPVWALVAWNLGVYVAMAAAGLAPRAVARGPRRWLRVLFRAPADRSAALQRFAQDWASVGAALHGERIAALLHAAAAALALGVVGGLYLRGVVLDYRVGWESTFLDGHSVHRVLAWLMAPASVLTGIGLPDAAAIEALRLKPGEAARGAAAPWLHLYAASLALAVLGPRLLLAAAALARAAWRARRMPWPAADPWLERVRAQAPQSAQRAWLLPHARALPAQAALAWRERLSALSAAARAAGRRDLTAAERLVSHTNVGKTLGRWRARCWDRDVGEVRDAPHVTEFAEAARAAAQRRRRRTDAVGHARLRRQRAPAAPAARRAAATRWAGSCPGVGPLARPRVLGQPAGAAPCARARADVVLYLVNASEQPAKPPATWPPRWSCWTGSASRCSCC